MWISCQTLLSYEQVAVLPEQETAVLPVYL